MTTVLVAGGGGHVGAALVERLRAQGVDVRAVSRSGGDGLVAADVSDRAAMLEELDGVDAAYYLVHSLGAAGGFGDEERRAAETFASAARERGVPRLIYLGGIVPEGELSPHLESRRAVGEILRESGVPTIELRASIVVGAGSASFELVRDLVGQLPVVVAPAWLENAAQPIALEDVLAYLVAALDLPLAGSVVYEIGGADPVPYRAILEALGGTTATLPAPGAAATVATLLKPLQPARARVVSDLLDSLRVDTSVHDRGALGTFSVRPRGLADAIASAGARG